MPTSTVNWLWLGNSSLVDATASTNVTQAELDASGLAGYSAFGSAQIAAVAVTGTTTTTATTNSSAEVFTAAFNPKNGVTSQFSFETPTTTGVTSNQTISSMFQATVEIELPDGTQTTQIATVVQMSNGDLFLRPNATYVSSWDGIDSVRSITLTSVTPFGTNTVLNSTISFNPSIFDIEVPCFTAGTLIRTPGGLRAVEDLKAGDLVTTADRGAQPIRWIKARHIPPWALNALPRLRPIRIAAGALGNGSPRNDLLISPQHRILVRSKITKRMFDAAEVLVAAKHLLGLPGISLANDVDEVTYLHFLCDRHEVVFANGAPTETLLAGQIAMRSLDRDSLAEIQSLFPDLAAHENGLLRPARPLVHGRQGRAMAKRHSRNQTQLFAA